MDLSNTHRLGLPLLHAGQAQKEIWHNEALALLDLLVQPVVLSVGATEPPAAPGIGDCHVVGDGGQGAWAGRDHAIAGWTAAGWRFVPPIEGMRFLIAETMAPLTFTGGAWRAGVLAASALTVNGLQVVGERGDAVAAPNGGTTIDSEARTAISSIISALVAHGLIASPAT